MTMTVDQETLKAFGDSLARCNGCSGFVDRFYEIFLASSPKVRQKFAHTDFDRQKAALQASLDLMLSAAADPRKEPDPPLHHLAERHSSRQLNIGAEYYDLWLDSLLAAVKECDPEYNAQIEAAWEKVMMVGIRYMLSRY